jgi:hypothetical protein
MSTRRWIQRGILPLDADVDNLICFLPWLTRKEREYLRKFIKRNQRLIQRKQVLIVRNNALGIIRLLHLLGRLSTTDKIFPYAEIHPLGREVDRWPREFLKLASKKRLGKRERFVLERRLGLI